MDHPRPTEDVRVSELMDEHAGAVARWRYSGPWSVYDGNKEERISADLGYHAILERSTGAFLGFFCLGADARVPGLSEKPGVLDLGVGLAPEIVGHGRGAAIVAPVLDWIAARSDAARLRAVVQAWNERSVRFCGQLGFELVAHHRAPQHGGSVDYLVLERPLGGDGTPTAPAQAPAWVRPPGTPRSIR